MAQGIKFYGTGRRKNAIAKVWLTPGSGTVTINKRELGEYFGKKTLEMIVRQPLELTSTSGKYDVIASVHGGHHRPGRSGTPWYYQSFMYSRRRVAPRFKRGRLCYPRPKNERETQIRLEKSQKSQSVLQTLKWRTFRCAFLFFHCLLLL